MGRFVWRLLVVIELVAGVEDHRSTPTLPSGGGKVSWEEVRGVIDR